MLKCCFGKPKRRQLAAQPRVQGLGLLRPAILPGVSFFGAPGRHDWPWIVPPYRDNDVNDWEHALKYCYPEKTTAGKLTGSAWKHINTNGTAVVSSTAPAQNRKGPPPLSDAVEQMGAEHFPRRVADEWEIGEALAELAHSGNAVSVYPQGGPDPVLARVLSVHPAEPHFVLELNKGGAVPAGSATLVAWLKHSKLQFKLSSAWAGEPEAPQRVPLDFPEECLILERRGATRLEAPLGSAYLAAFVLDGKPYEFQLYDFSATGIGMRASPREAAGMFVGRHLSRVRLQLGPGPAIVGDLEIRLSRSFRSFLLGEQVQIGCRFTALAPDMQERLERVLESLGNGRGND
jgi:hypothetical protein